MSLSEAEVQDAVVELKRKRQINEQSGFGSRVVKYKHRFCNTEFGDLKFTDQQLAIVCVLLLRGPQTPGELRTRTQRLAEFASVAEVEQVLHSLEDFNGDTLVVKLEREPGKRESRYLHQFTHPGEVPVQISSDQSPSALSIDAQDAEQRIAALENQVSELAAQLKELQQQFDELLGN